MPYLYRDIKGRNSIICGVNVPPEGLILDERHIALDKLVDDNLVTRDDVNKEHSEYVEKEKAKEDDIKKLDDIVAEKSERELARDAADNSLNLQDVMSGQQRWVLSRLSKGEFTPDDLVKLTNYEKNNDNRSEVLAKLEELSNS